MSEPPLIRHLPPAPDEDALLTGFTAYTEELGIELYAAQEEAIIEVLVGNHVILNTPTGSGKSLVATAAHYAALAADGGASTPPRSRRWSARSSSPSAASSARTTSA